MNQRREFAQLAMREEANRRQLCSRFGISPDTGYRWLARYLAGDEELADRSRRPRGSPRRCSPDVEALVLAVRDSNPAWGARKIARCLERDGLVPPAISTVHQVLRRHERVSAPVRGVRAYQRFEKEAPNLLWQMDFKGWVRLRNQARCHPLTIVDDHSRFAVCLAACADEQGSTVQRQLELTFRRYGLPDAVFVDNGGPWGDSSGTPWTRLGVWLLKLGIDVVHSRPFHPQSRGKNERFHRTLKAEVFAFQNFHDLGQVQRAFDRWRIVYNFDRPHDALDLEVPANRYRPSIRSMPERLPQVAYDENEIVRAVSTTRHSVRFKGRLWMVPRAFCGERVAIRPSAGDGHYGVFFGAREIAQIHLRDSNTRADGDRP